MVNIMRRMRQLRALLWIRVGPGAAILPPEVARIDMDFSTSHTNGHAGPRKFWREYLPRLKYHNPAVPMTVSRTADKSSPATMTIRFTAPTGTEMTPPTESIPTTTQTLSTPVTESTQTEPISSTATINMKYRTESQILDQLIALTNMVPIEPVEEELKQMRELKEQQILSERDSERSLIVNSNRKRTEAVLAKARGEMAAAKEV